MRVGLNLLYLIPRVVGGTEVYAVSLIKALAAVDRENEYFVFVNQEAADLELTDAPNFHRIVCPFQATRRPVRYTWEQVILPWQLRHYQIDVLHSLAYVGPLFCPCASVVTTHDLNYVALGDLMRPVKRRALAFFCAQSARRSTHVITGSSFSKSEILNILGLDPARVTVVHNGPGQAYSLGMSASWDFVRQRYNLPEAYVVAFSSTSPHKNIARLVDAFDRACYDLVYRLVLIGHPPPGIGPVGKLASPVDRIRMLGYIPSSHVMPILEHADLFIFPSLYEGFGFPILEAQEVGLPVVCSTAGALPEVVDKSAVFFDPGSVEDMSEAVRRCLLHSDLRTGLRHLAAENVKRFSWEKAAAQTLTVYRHVCSKG